MMKWITCLILAALVAGSWMMFTKTDGKIKTLNEQIDRYENQADSEADEKLPVLRAEMDSLKGEKTFNGILLTFLGAGLVGIVFVVYLLPFFAQRVTHSVYDSAEMVEQDVMHTARSLMAQGDYQGAIDAFREAAAADPLNRLPWVEIAKIQKDNLEDAPAAIQTIRHALESQAWEVNDAAYFLFRLAELYDEVEGDRASAIAIMNQVVEQFPGTRHSANASHKLHEWSMQDAGATTANEEAAFLAKMKREQGGQS